jgi:hypothetical protein
VVEAVHADAFDGSRSPELMMDDQAVEAAKAVEVKSAARTRFDALVCDITDFPSHSMRFSRSKPVAANQIGANQFLTKRAEKNREPSAISLTQKTGK